MALAIIVPMGLQTGSLNVRLIGYYDTPGWAQGVYVSGGYAYVADRGAGLRIINEPLMVKKTKTGDFSLKIFINTQDLWRENSRKGVKL